MEAEPLLWIRTGWLRREYALMHGSEPLARLAFQGWSSDAIVETPERSWTIRRTGIWKPRVSIQHPEFAIAATVHWSGNFDLDEPVDGAFRWRSLHLFKMHFGWVGFDGAAIIRYRPEGFFSYRAHWVDFLDRSALTESRLMLTMIGGYFLAQTHDDLGAMAAASS